MENKYLNIHQELIDLCKTGNRKAQAEIYKLYYRPMFNTSLRIVNDKMEAEDIIQESFFAAFKKLNSYSGEVSFGAWLKRIVINRSLDFLKKRKINFEQLDSKLNKLPESTEEVEEEIINLEVEKVKKAINQLADGYRIIISLYLLEGYDHDEIAEITGITSASSRSQLVRAKRKVISLMNEM